MINGARHDHIMAVLSCCRSVGWIAAVLDIEGYIKVFIDRFHLSIRPIWHSWLHIDKQANQFRNCASCHVTSQPANNLSQSMFRRLFAVRNMLVKTEIDM